MNYARAMKTLRGAKGLSQTELAKLIGKTPSYLSKIESGERVPATVVVEGLCIALGVPYYLFALLASDEQDIKNLPAKETQALADNLLKVLVGDSAKRR